MRRATSGEHLLTYAGRMTPDADPHDHEARVRQARTREDHVGLLRTSALTLLFIGCGLILLMHVIPPTASIDPIDVTISEYGRTSLGWLFSIAVVTIALGSVAALAQFVRAEECRLVSVPTFALALWIIGMIGVAVFPKADWAAGATTSGYIHRAASVVAFFGLAVAIAALILGDRTPNVLTRTRPPRRMSHQSRLVAGVCAIAACLAMLVLGVYIAISEATGVHWWEILPLGLWERLLVMVELTGLIALIITTRPRRHPSV